MNILHITDTMDYPTGVSRYIHEVVALFRAKGHLVDIWSPPGIGDDLESLFTRWISYRHSRELGTFLRKNRYDVLHVHNISLRLSPFPLREARTLGIPTVMTIHDFNLLCPRKWMINNRNESCDTGFGWACLAYNCWSSRIGTTWLPYHQLRWLKTAFHRYLLRRYVNLFLCPSRILRDGITLSLKTDRAVHLPNFVHLPLLRPLSKPGKSMVYAGRLSIEKGMNVLLYAMPSIVQKHPRVTLTIIGDGPEKKNLKRLSKKLMIQDRVCFIGNCETDVVTRIVQEASLAILPSVWLENGPMFALESLAAGTPLIGANAGGLSEIIQDGKNGYLVKRGHSEDLANRIIQALGDPNWLLQASVEARHTAEEEYAPARHYEKLSEIYASIV